MARRWWVRGVVWSGVGLASLIGVLLVVLVLVTQSAFGRERVRQIAERVAARYLLGSLHVGALRFGPGCALAIDSAALRDPDDSLLVSLGPTRATCAFGALVRGQLIVKSLDVTRPSVVVRQSASGVWNWSRAIRPDTSPPKPPEPSPGPPRVVVVGTVRLSGGALVLEVPWGPPDSLRGVARDRAIEAALAARAPFIRRSGNSLVRRREYSGIAIDAPLVRTQIGDTTVIVILNGLAGVSADPAITVRRIAGRFALIGSSIDVDLPSVVFNASSTRVDGRLDWGGDGAPAIQAAIAADTIAFADIALFVPNVPRSGGGRVQLAIEGAGGSAPTRYRVTSADLHTTRSTVRGGAALEFSGSNGLAIHDVALDVAPLHSDLVRIIVPGRIPAGLRGALTARVVARGTSARGALRIDTLDARYADEAVPGSTSRLTAHGTVTLGGDAGMAFSRLVVALAPVDVRTVERLVPALSPLSGRLTGRVTLDSTIEHLRLGDVDVRYAEGAAAPLHLTGGGRVDLGDVPRFDIAAHARPFSPAALALSFPALATLPDVDAQVEVLGSARDLTFATSATSAAGSVALAGRYGNGATGVAIHATGNVRDLDPRAASARANVPAGKLAADVDVDLRGESFAKLRGSAALANVRGLLAGVTIEPSIARVALTDSRVVAESVVVATSAGVVSARGALGLRAGIRDTLAVTASLELARLAPLLRTLGVVDSAGSDSTDPPGAVVDSIGGTVTARARLTGSLDSLAGDGEVDATAVTSPFATARRVHATWAMAGLRSRPHGRASLRADSLAAGSVHLASAAGTAQSDDGNVWRVSLGTTDADRPGGAAAGTIAMREDTVAISLDSLLLRAPGTDLRLTRPSAVRRVADGTITLDTLQLRGTRGAVITASGVYRGTGPIAVSLDVTNVPVVIPGPGAPGDSVRILLDATARLEGTAQSPRAAADMRARVADGDSLPIDSVVAHLAYADDRAQLDVGAHARTRSLVSGRAEGPMELSLSPFKATMLDAPLTGQLSIDSLYLPDISSLVPGARFTGGVLRTHLTLSGTARKPRAVGNASLASGAAHIAALGIEVHDANARLDLSSDRIAISNATVRAGKDPEGRADLSGTVELADSGQVTLQLRTSGMPVMRLPESADLDVTSDLRLVGPRERPTLSGRVTVDQGVLRLPDMGRAGIVGVNDSAYVRLVDSLAPARLERASTALDRFAIGDVQVQMGPNVWLRSAEASVQLGGSIGLEPAAPGPSVAKGQVALRGRLVTQRGNYRLNIGAFTRSFQLEQGSIQFTGEPELNPRLDINALYSREGSDGLPASRGRAPKVRAHLGGTLERPVLTLSSADAKLTQAELMSYLVTGQANSAVGNALDESVVTSELVASATGALAQRLAGGRFDVVNVTAGANTNDNDNRATAGDMFASTRLGVGKQLSSRVFLKVDAGLCALTGGASSADIGQTLGVSLDYRFHRGVLGSVSSAPSTNGSTCANQAAGRGTALTPRQWGLDFTRIWRF